MRAVLYRAKTLNDSFANFIGKILSWSIWFTIMVIGTAIWLSAEKLSHGRFDPNGDELVLILTIVTALDAGATKLFQLSLRRQDEKQDAQAMLLLESISHLTVAIREELDQSRERDDATKIRDEEAARRDEVKRKIFNDILITLNNLEDRMIPSWEDLVKRIEQRRGSK